MKEAHIDELEKYLILIKEKRTGGKESWIKQNLPKLYNSVSNIDGESISEKIYIYINGKTFCKMCGNKTKFLSFNRGYRVYCSKICSNTDPELNQIKVINFKESFFQKYGVENPMDLESIKDKVSESHLKLDKDEIYKKSIETNLKKYGVENPSQSEEVKQKKIETSLKKYGVENPFQSDEIKEKSKQTILEKYDVDHISRSEDIKDRKKKTLLKKYNVDNYTKTDEYKELILNKYKLGEIETKINIDPNFVDYLGESIYLLRCDCDLEHNYKINQYQYFARVRINTKLCTKCYPINSLTSCKENELLDYIKSIYNDETIQSYRDGLEIDIYLPKIKIGFEFNGVYWHSEEYKDRNYHINKTKYFEERGIKIIHIWEDDWTYKTDILKSQIKNWLGLNNGIIYARNCEIKEVDNYKDFLNENHIQGYIPSSIRLGLYYNNELVSIMTFDHFEGRKLMLDNEWNLSRFCNIINKNVIGGASKLLSYFIEKYNPIRIISFADMEWSKGNLYKKLGFNLKSISKPNYKYVVNDIRVNKRRFMKSILVDSGEDPNLSESEIMDNKGYYKVFDCGQMKFELILKQI